VLDDLHVESTADQQRRQVVPEVVEAEGLGQPGDLRSRRADRPLDGPCRGLPTSPVGDDVFAAPPGHGCRQLEHEFLRDRERRTGCLRLERLAVTLTDRPHDAPHEVDVLDAQPDRLGGAQPDERAEQDGRAQVLGDRVVQPPDLLGRGDVGPLTTRPGDVRREHGFRARRPSWTASLMICDSRECSA